MHIEEISKANRARCTRWHEHDNGDWSGADWSNAVCGEVGEMANVVKKIRRYETGVARVDEEMSAFRLRELMADLAEEMADVFLYLDLLADHYGVDLPKSIVDKFNRVSIERGYPDRLTLDRG